jgi:hypothetical protein
MCAFKPNLKAPRFREKVFNVLSKKLFLEFQEKNEEYKDMTYNQFKEIINTFNRKLYNGVLENRNGVELPEGLGYLFIGTCDASKKRNIDFKKSIACDTVVSHRNWDSDNHLMKIFYTNSKVRYPIPNKQLWIFTASREFKRKASAVYKVEWTKFIKVDNTQRVSALFEKARVRDYAINKKHEDLIGYDEFKT